MPRKPRYQVADPTETQVFHAIQRCVRSTLLCGKDRFSGQSYEHRRDWICERLEFLTSVLAIDCLTYPVRAIPRVLLVRQAIAGSVGSVRSSTR
jgi:hypothetical protein